MQKGESVGWWASCPAQSLHAATLSLQPPVKTAENTPAHWQETSSPVDVCTFWWTWWQAWQMIGALLWVLLRNTAMKEYSTQMPQEFISHLLQKQLLQLRTSLSSWLAKIGRRVKVITTSKPMGYKSSLHLFLGTADCYDLLMNSTPSISVLNSVCCLFSFSKNWSIRLFKIRENIQEVFYLGSFSIRKKIYGKENQ